MESVRKFLDDETFLFTVCAEDDIDSLNLLIENGLDIRKYRYNAFRSACRNSSFKIFEKLIGLGLEFNDSIFLDVVSRGKLEMAKRLLELGADVNCKSSLLEMRPIFIAAETGSIEMFKLLVDNGADCWVRDILENSLAHYACRYHKDDKFLRYFAESGVDFNCKNYRNETPLFIASHYRNSAAVEFLLSQKVNVNFCDVHGNSPLHAAVEDNNLSFIDVCIVENLIKNGAYVNAKNAFGDTPLHLIKSFRRNFFETVLLLLNNGADIYTLIRMATRFLSFLI